MILLLQRLFNGLIFINIKYSLFLLFFYIIASPAYSQEVSPFTLMSKSFATVVCAQEWGIIEAKEIMPSIFKLWSKHGIDLDTQKRVLSNSEFMDAVSKEIKAQGGCKTILREMGYKI